MLLAIEIVGDEAEVREEDEDAVSVRDGGGRRAMIEDVLEFASGGADRLPPLELSCRAAEGHRDQVVAFGSGENDVIADEDGGGVADRHFCLPEDVLLRAELGGQLTAGGAQTGAARTA